MTVHIPRMGSFRDNLSVYEVAIWLWNQGERRKALLILEMLVEHIETSQCARSRRLLLETARSERTLMQSQLLSGVHARARKHKTKVPLNWFNRLVTVQMRKAFATAIYYAAIVLLSFIALGQVPEVTLAI